LARRERVLGIGVAIAILTVGVLGAGRYTVSADLPTVTPAAITSTTTTLSCPPAFAGVSPLYDTYCAAGRYRRHLVTALVAEVGLGVLALRTMLRRRWLRPHRRRWLLAAGALVIVAGGAAAVLTIEPYGRYHPPYNLCEGGECSRPSPTWSRCPSVTSYLRPKQPFDYGDEAPCVAPRRARQRLLAAETAGILVGAALFAAWRRPDPGAGKASANPSADGTPW
jgi:hypothetical protein